MKKALLALLVLCLTTTVYGQLIKGIVLDEQTGSPVDYASVFFNGTFVGTTTNEKGGFELDVSKYRTRPLYISAVGYYPQVITDFNPAEIQRVLLKPRVFEIEEVSVVSKSLVRKRKACMRIFEHEFIGNTTNARRCYILNEEDITFNYASDKDTLKAYARRPLRIQNLSLGYDITYYLERFEYDRKNKKVLYTGSIIFNRDLVTDEESLKRYERKREYAYTGSGKHFFRVLWSNSLKSSGFEVKNYRTSDKLKYENIVTEEVSGRKYLHYGEELVIRYFDKLSYISFLKEKVYFEQDGFFDPTGIIWSGTIAKQRIADFLPYEYSFGR
jgi:hypothetical protein